MNKKIEAKIELAKEFDLTFGGTCRYKPNQSQESKAIFQLIDVWITGWDIEMGKILAPDGETTRDVPLWHLKPNK